MKHHIIYVPGINDDIGRLQSCLLWFWRLFGVRAHLHAMPWLGEGAFQPKLQDLLDQIDTYHGRDYKVSLIGASAGASAVLHAYVQRRDKINGLVYICGKINRPETVSDRTYGENPAFKESLYTLSGTLKQLAAEDKRQMLSVYSPADTTVTYRDTIIPGIPEKSLPALRHGVAIIYAITFGALGLIRFLKQL